MAFRPLLASILMSLVAATAIIQDAHATEQPRRQIASQQHHHEHKCKSHGKSVPCKAAKKVHKTKKSPQRSGGWTITEEVAAAPGPMSHVVTIAEQFDGMSESGDRTQLAQFFDDTLDMKIDPRRTAWCAAFVNGVLAKAGKETTGSIEGRSFLDWGNAVKTPQEGDVVVMRGVSRRSPTHVGFYVGSAKVNGRTYYGILGGNQSNMVKISWFPASKVITIRRAG